MPKIIDCTKDSSGQFTAKRVIDIKQERVKQEHMKRRPRDAANNQALTRQAPVQHGFDDFMVGVNAGFDVLGLFVDRIVELRHKIRS